MHTDRIVSMTITCAIGAASHAAPVLQDQPGGAAIHEFDFWQESAALTFPNRTADSTCADLDGDGYPELVRLGIAFGNPLGGTLGITLGGPYGARGPELHRHRLSSPKHVLATDVNGDGLTDLIVTHLAAVPGSTTNFTRNATFYVQTGTGALDFLTPPPTVQLAPGGERVLLLDVDRDQIADLVSTGKGHELYYQRGLGWSTTTPLVPRFATQPTSISVLAAQNAGLPPGSSLGFGIATGLATGDFDGDGSADLAVSASTAFGGGIHVYYRRSTGWVHQGFVTPLATGTGAESYSSLTAGDFDGDGLDDLAATAPNLDLTTLLNNGPTGSGPPFTGWSGMTLVRSAGVGKNWNHVAAADLNGDAFADLAFFDDQQRVAVLYNPGASGAPGTFSSSPLFHARFDMTGSGARSLHASDVDLDGDVDLVGSFIVSRSTSVLSNERLANARKPISVSRLRGDRSSVSLSTLFVPDALEYLQAQSLGSASSVVADLFTFRVEAAPDSRLHLRLRLRARQAGVLVRIGVLDPVTRQMHWVLAAQPGPVAKGFSVMVPDAPRFVSSAQRIHVVVSSSGNGHAFRTAIDQLSAEVIP